MVVVTGIIEAAKIALRIAPIIYKGVKYSRQGMRYASRHPNIAKYGTIAASSAPIIYDLLNIDYSAIQKKIPRRSFPKTRNQMGKPGTRRFNKADYCASVRYPSGRYNRRYRYWSKIWRKNNSHILWIQFLGFRSYCRENYRLDDWIPSAQYFAI